jgi:hypothetical protein
VDFGRQRRCRSQIWCRCLTEPFTWQRSASLTAALYQSENWSYRRALRERTHRHGPADIFSQCFARVAFSGWPTRSSKRRLQGRGGGPGRPLSGFSLSPTGGLIGWKIRGQDTLHRLRWIGVTPLFCEWRQNLFPLNSDRTKDDSAKIPTTSWLPRQSLAIRILAKVADLGISTAERCSFPSTWEYHMLMCTLQHK